MTYNDYDAASDLLAAAIAVCETLEDMYDGAPDGPAWMAEPIRVLKDAIHKAGGAVAVPGAVR